MTATLTGISTIRATKAEERLILEFDDFQNVHSAVWQMLMSVNTGRCCKAINITQKRAGLTKQVDLTFPLSMLYFLL